MADSRPPLHCEILETRENPTTLFTESFDHLSPPTLPRGWSSWSSDTTTVFSTAANSGLNNSNSLVSQAGSRTAGITWHPEAVTGDTGVAASIFANSLVPVFIFTRGNDLSDPATRSYLAAVVTRGLRVQLLEVTGTTAKVLGSVSSPNAAYFSNGWVRVSLIPVGTTVQVEVTRHDTGQYLNASGTWQTTPTSAITATTTLTPRTGHVGVGRNALYFGAVALDNFAAVTDPTISYDPIRESFDTTNSGQRPQGWMSWVNTATGAFSVSSTRSNSPSHGYASHGQSNTTARSWADTKLPADVNAAAAIYLDSLIPAQIFVRGSNLDTSRPTFYAVQITRGLEAQLVKVVEGTETTLASIKSNAYFSGRWARVRLIADGDRLRLQIYRPDTQQWLAPDGNWSSSPDFALEIRDTSITGPGHAGIGRRAAVAGTLTIDDFEAQPAGVDSGPRVRISRLTGHGDVTGEVTFQAQVTGAFTKIEFRLNNVVRAISAAAPATWTFDSTTVANGRYNLVVRAFDAAGNVGTAELVLNVVNPNMDPLPTPEIPRHYPHIRIAQLAYTGTPITNSFEQNLLKNSVDLVVANPRFLGTIDEVAPNTPQLIYSNVSNLYQQLLIDWLNYADRVGVSRELAFYHVTEATAFQGSSPSSQPVTWFWGTYQWSGNNTPTDVTSAARAGRNFFVQFGGAGTNTAIGYLEKFREMNITLTRGASTGWSGVWEYVTATDAQGLPTQWKSLTLLQDTTNALRSSGRITFDPPADWVPAAMLSGGERLYYVRFRATQGTATQGAELFSVLGRDYVGANGRSSGIIPAFDYTADVDGDGYLNDTEYANRQPGMDARFVYESRLFYPYYGQMRFVTNPSASAVRRWAADYHVRLLEANPLADGLFMDNATGKVPFPGVNVLEPTATFSDDSGALMAVVSRAIAPKWVLANTAGGATTADAITRYSAGVLEEFLLRPLAANWSQVLDAAELVNRRLNSDNRPYVVLDSSPQGGSRFDGRTQMATLAYYYLLADPDRTFLMFYGGDSPSSSWTGRWSPAVEVNVGLPTGAMRVFATGNDPANAALTYRVYAREYENALILYKPLSYTLGQGTGTTANTTATTHQLGGTYRIVNSNGTLGAFVTSITLRNGEGAILLKVA
ncbi:MAG: hypothetical protein RMJ56_06775 [Gemmataceae bacterium]|nr:hypothetical protein [Gemmata sp.]MDW8197293.1 hypothetical protein [Gemmataceae bacterium]